MIIAKRINRIESAIAELGHRLAKGTLPRPEQGRRLKHRLERQLEACKDDLYFPEEG